jgi:hypothetical protein|tara:strand:+ start:441 stop:650 length:210 start_codon:yes stop_codon:yes gene_type:complete
LGWRGNGKGNSRIEDVLARGEELLFLRIEILSASNTNWAEEAGRRLENSSASFECVFIVPEIDLIPERR